jgi:hypothetical protein
MTNVAFEGLVSLTNDNPIIGLTYGKSDY